MNNQDYLALDFRSNPAVLPVSRRDFLKQLGGGIFIFVSLPDPEYPGG